MNFSLVVNQGSKQGREIPVNKAEFSVGRDAKCNLRPASQHVSKKHCVLRIRGEQVFVEDCQSTNGTFINEVQVQGEQELHDGDRLRIGPLEFGVKLESAQTQVPHPKAPAKVPAKAPAKAPPPSTTEPVNEDDIGSMLLSLSEEEKANAEEGEIDEGSTVMQILKPEEMEQLQSANEKAPYRPTAAKPSASGTSSSAAKNILEKYRRRPKS
jgi:pSer/pThr/pTyr-binding forkhead associated (FHA) protein